MTDQMWPVSVKGVVVADGHVLLLKNERDEWELPGGRIERGESPEQCLTREIIEETGLTVAVQRIVDSWVFPVVPGHQVVIVTYGCRPLDHVPELTISSEHGDGRFVPIADCPGYEIPDGYRASIDAWYPRVAAATPHDERIGGIELAWRAPIDDHALNRIHAEAFAHELFDDRWAEQLDRHSLGWITATEHGALVGFINVVGDGGVHAWLQDVIVTPSAQHRGIGRAMVDLARRQATQAGCEWLHVDFDDELGAFYFDACGFEPTAAGLIRLR